MQGGVLTEVLALKNITKKYPGVTALDNVSISFERGEVHALVGENGAGKSTFIKSISGAIRPTSGTIVFEGKEYPYMEPAKAIDMGIAVVYQELIQFEAMSIADNIFMSVKDEKGIVLNDKARHEKTRELLKAFDCNLDPGTLIRNLSIAERQIVELVKATVKNAKVVIMDERYCQVFIGNFIHTRFTVRPPVKDIPTQTRSRSIQLAAALSSSIASGSDSLSAGGFIGFSFGIFFSVWAV